MEKATFGEYEAWASRHAGIFGLLKAEERQMLQLWRPIFLSCGYTAAELRYATEMIARDPPKYRGEHLDRIHSVIGQLRKKSTDDEAESLAAIEEFEKCKNCGDLGWVFVPNPKYLSSGEWTPYPGTSHKPTAVVTCSCNIGQRVSSTHQKKQPMGLEKYEERNPDWRQQVAEEYAAGEARRKAVSHTAAMDQKLGSLVEGIAKNMDAKPQIYPLGPGERKSLGEAAEAAKELEGDARRSRQRPARNQLRLFDEPAEGSGNDDRVTEGLKS